MSSPTAVPGPSRPQTYNSTNYWVDVTFHQTARQRPGLHLAGGFSARREPDAGGHDRRQRRRRRRASPTRSSAAPTPALFRIDAATGELRFRTAPDFEAPADAGANNVYNLTVSASDGTLPAVERAIAVTVTDVATTNRAPTTTAIVAPATNEDAAVVQIALLPAQATPTATRSSSSGR